VVAGGLVKASCKRHLEDLANGAARGLTFRPDLASRAVGFFPAVLTITDGSKAGSPFELLPWHKFVVASLFGWCRADGTRRFRQAWIETGKGQAKSPLMAAIGLYLGGFVGVPRAQIYAIASDRKQANVLFRDAAAMCRAPIPGYEDDGETLESRGDVVIRGAGDNAWKIEFMASGGFFQSLASVEAISGPRPYAVLADEIHEMKTSRAIQLWKAAIDKMSGDPIMILGTNTPAADQTVGTEYSEMVQRVVTGQAQDDATFGFIARVDESDDPLNDESCWAKSLPALGLTYPIDNIRARVVQAKLMLSEALSTKRLYFGIPVGTTEFWVSEEAWLSCQGEVDEEAMVGKPCWLSLDLSKKNDLSALTACWRDGERLLTKTWYWMSKDHLLERERDDSEPYGQWASEGFLSLVPGAVIDYRFIAQKVLTLARRHDVQFMAYDSAFIQDFIAASADVNLAAWKYRGPDEPQGEGLKLVSHGQGNRILFREGALSMPKSIVALEDAILNKQITIDRSKVTEMCARNAHVTADAMNNRAFDKKRSRGRIDGLVTNAMAVGAAASHEVVNTITDAEILSRGGFV
jgi:phage terminase large subunit-like protein